jgi:hypothetical protein
MHDDCDGNCGSVRTWILSMCQPRRRPGKTALRIIELRPILLGRRCKLHAEVADGDIPVTRPARADPREIGAPLTWTAKRSLRLMKGGGEPDFWSDNARRSGSCVPLKGCGRVDRGEP